MLDFQRLFAALPGLYIIYDLDFVIVGGSDAYFQATKTQREEVVGRHLFEVFPDNPDDPNADGVRNLRASLESVLKHRQPHTMAIQKYDIRRPESEGGGFEERYWTPVNSPFFNETGEMTHIIHRAQDVTEFVRVQQQRNEQRQLNQVLQSRTDQMEMEIYARVQELRAVNEQLQTANEALSELDRAKTTFFSNVSHEFRTPLTLMLSPLEDTIANLDGSLPPQEREQLQLVHRNGVRLLKLVNSLLDFSRIEARRVQAAYEPTDLATYTAELASTFRSLIERAGMSLVVDCLPLPEAVYIDREMWEKIVLNLVSNAFKFTFTGSITVRLKPVGDYVELSVADTGVGIPEAELPRLFERFHRVSGTRSRTYEGSGIGLALVQELVKLHGGTIQVTSQLEQGTTFTIAIPFGSTHLPSEHIRATRTLTSTALGADPYVVEASRWISEEGTGRGTEWTSGQVDENLSTHLPIYPSTHLPKILLADDNADMRDYIRRLLSGAYTVETVADGTAALSAIQDHPPDLVLTDVMMPGMDGVELLRALRSNPQTGGIPIILLSARAGEEARLEGLAAGADDYLTKPFSARELLARVEATLKLSRLRQEALQQEQMLRAESVFAQQKAETAWRRIDQLLESMSEAFVALDRDWRITYQNAAAEQVNNKPRSEVLGKTLWEEWPAAAGTVFEQQYRHALAEQVPVHFEYCYYEPPDHDVWLEVHAHPFEDGLGIFYRDINDRKRSEEELRASEQRFRDMADHAPMMVWLTDSTGYCTYLSRSWYDFSGQTEADGLGVGWLDVVHPDDSEAAKATFLSANQRQEAFQLEYRLRCKDGEYRTCIDAARPWLGADGEFQGYIGSVIDIEDRIRAEAALRQNEEQTRNILESIHESFFALDENWQFTYVNRSAEVLLDRTPGDLIGKNLWEEYPGWSSNELAQVYWSAMRDRVAASLTAFYPDHDRWYEVRTYPAPHGITVYFRNITEQVETATTLRQSEERYRTLFELIDEGFCVIELLFDQNNTSIDYRFLEVNPAFEHQSGLQHAVGKTARQLNLENHWIEIFGQVASTGESVRFESGSTILNRWFDVYACRLGESEARKVALVFKDISDRKRAEEISQRAAELDAFRVSLADALRPLADPMEVQATASRVLGQYLGTNRVAYFEVRGADYVVERDYVNGAEAIAGGYPIDSFGPKLLAEYRAGRTVSVSDVTADPNLSPDQRAAYDAIQIGAYIGIPLVKGGEFVAGLAIHNARPRVWTPDEVALAEEVAERTWAAVERARAEADLRDSENRFRMALEAAELGTWDWNLITDQLLWDEGCKAMFGLPLEAEGSIEVFFTGLHSEDCNRLEQAVRWALNPASYGKYDVEYRVIGIQDGVERWIAARGQVYFDAVDNPQRFIGTVLNITQQKRIEAERAQLLAREQAAREAADRANQIKDEFLAVLSHELRSPLNPILGWSKLLQQRKLDEARTTTALMTIERNAQLQVQLIDDLLDISRILRGKLSLTMLPVDLSTVISGALETVRLAAEAKAIEIQTMTAPGVGIVLGDAGRLQQVVWNLLSNAVKFTPQRGQVTVALISDENCAQLQVSDTGKGIKSDFLPYVFEHFRQEDGATTRKFGGLGLGLAIVRQMVELHGGTVAVNSLGEGQGATFTVQIPLASRLAVLPAIEPLSESSTGDLSGIRILVVDDEADSREFVAFVLEQAGAVVTDVASGIGALQAFSQTVPDLLVSDIGMPEMDGYMLIRQIRHLPREQGGQIPAIALTAYAGELDQQQAIASGFQRHLAKPIEPNELIRTIATVTGRD